MALEGTSSGIDGHPGPPVATMKGGPRGHHGRISLTTSRKSTRQETTSGEWDGSQPEKTWRDRRTLKQCLSTTDIPSEKHGMLLWRALIGDAQVLISHFRDGELLRWDAGQKTFDVLAQAHQHISEFEDQDMTMTMAMLSTNCTESAVRSCFSLRMWPAPHI